jgi:DNA-directed RNA polymerase subunit RPC12/RpoP
MYKLHKMSGAGWTKHFNTEQEVFNELTRWVCSACKDDFFDEYGVHIKHLDDLLCTSCGCEFMVDHEE